MPAQKFQDNLENKLGMGTRLVQEQKCRKDTRECDLYCSAPGCSEKRLRSLGWIGGLSLSWAVDMQFA